MFWWSLWSKIVVDSDIRFKLHQATSSDASTAHACLWLQARFVAGSVRMNIIPSLRITTIKFIRNITDCFQGHLYLIT
jgi:hypothetical protein